MRLRFSLPAIPVSLVALALWAVVGGWYVALVPAGLSGTDNIGIVLSTFGACLFLADRLAWRWFACECWAVFFKLWGWGLLLAAWGLVEWLRAFQPRYGWHFAGHWLAFALFVAAAWLLPGRRPGRDAAARRPRDASGPISLRPR